MLDRRTIRSFAVYYALVAGTALPALLYVGYQMQDPEFLLTCVGLLVPTLVLERMANAVPLFGRLIPAAMFVAYLQVYWPAVTENPFSIGAIALVAVASFWLAGPSLVELVAVALLAGVAATFLETTAPVEHTISDGKTKESSKPPVIHILLDEHASDWGLPDGVISDQDRERLWNPLVERGFAVFDRSFSQSINTAQSLVRFFNPHSTSPDDLLRKIGPRWEITKAQALDKVTDDRDLFMLINSYADPSPAVKQNPQVATLERWHVTQPMMAGLNIPVMDRVAVEAATIFAWLADRQKVPLFRWLYNDSPYKDWLQQRMFSRSHPQFASALQMLNRLKTELADHGRRGRYYFVHLMLPHFPYVYDRTCRLKPSREWLNRKAIPGPDTHATRALRYHLHVDQALCLQSMLLPLIDGILKNPDMADAAIILHGDHGARISSTSDEVWRSVGGTEEEYEHDWRGSMLAIRVPGIAGVRVKKVTDAVDIYRQMVEGDFSAATLKPLIDPAEPKIPAEALLSAPVDPLSGIVGNGWYDATNNDGRWTGSRAEARLAVPAGESSPRLFLNLTSGAVPTTLAVAVNGRTVAERKLYPHQQFNLVKTVPDDLAGKIAQVTITSSATWEPKIDPDDDRKLGVLVSNLGFTAAPPPSIAQIGSPMNGSNGLTGDGWYDADREGARWTGAIAKARLAVPTDSGLHLVNLSVQAGWVATTLRVWADDVAIGTIPLAEHQQVSLHLPLPDSVTGKEVRIRLTADSTWNPTKFGKPDDNRELGVQVQRLSIIAVDVPTVARIDAPLDGTGGLVGLGWYGADREGTRWTRADAEARLTVPAGHEEHLLCLSAAAGPVSTTFQISLNDQPIRQGNLAPYQPIELQLPLPVETAGTIIGVRIGVTPTWIPAEFGYAGDHRSLGVRVRTLAVVDQQPGKACSARPNGSPAP